MSLGRIVLAPPERRELKRRARKRSLAAELVKRAEVILMLAAGHSYREIRQRLDCSDEYVREWKRRFQEDRWPDSIRVIAEVHAELGPRRLRRGFWSSPAKVRATERLIGAAIDWPKHWA